jgi:hypothetical protein
MFILEKPKELNLFPNEKHISEFSRLFLINLSDQDAIVKLADIDFKTETETPSYLVCSPEDIPMDNEINLIIYFNSIPLTCNDWYGLLNKLKFVVEGECNEIIFLSYFTPDQLNEMIEEQMLIANPVRDRTALADIKRQFFHQLCKFETYFYKNESHLEHEKENCIKSSILQYQSLWEKCTLSEKFILFDFASDDLVNTKNKRNILSLIGKGILKVNGKLDFTDERFRQYIVEIANTSPLLEMEITSKRRGGWNKIKGPIYLMLVIIVVFFLFTMQDIISGVTGVIVSIIGLAGALLRFIPAPKDNRDSN